MREKSTSDTLHVRRLPVTCRQTFPLNGEGIEQFSEVLDGLLKQMDIDRQNRIRIRFSFEESLLRLRDRFDEEQVFLLVVNSSLGRTYIQIEHEGDVFNPLSKTAVELEDWSGSLLTSIGLSPQYSYSKGKNTLRLNLRRKEMNAALKILIAVAIGILLGIILRNAIPDAAQDFIVRDILMPFYNFWVRLLSVLSGPVVFFIVCTSVLNTRALREEGGSSTRVVMRYFIFSMAAAVIAMAASRLIARPEWTQNALGIKASGYLDAFLQIMPENAVSPLMTSNTPQLLLLAFVLGTCISMLGPGADGLNRLVRQGNAVALLITEGVSRMVPYFAAILICMEIVKGDLVTLTGMWKVFAVSLVFTFGVLLLVCFHVSRSRGVAFRVLLKKLWPAFATAVRTGSLDTGFGEMERCCVEKLGLEKHFTTISLPYGMVLYMPANVIGTLIFTMFAAAKLGVKISPGWLFVMAVLTVMLFVATPPVPGANLLAYIMIFAQLGIPSVALIDAMIFDILFGIFASASNQALLQMELIQQASRMGLLNREKLKKSA